MLHDIFNTVIKDSLWILDLHIDERKEKVVHLPLIYASNVYAELEAYARAASHFVKLLGFDDSLQLKIVDDCVFKFNSSQYEPFKFELLKKLSGYTEYAIRIAQLSIETRNSFAQNCIELERRYVCNENIGNLFEKTYIELVTLISINLSNQVFETFYLFLNENTSNDELFQKFQRTYIETPTFSHLKWYGDETKKRIETETVCAVNAAHYFWNTAFLRQSIQNDDVSATIKFINEKTNSSYDVAHFLKNITVAEELLNNNPTAMSNKMPDADISDIEFIFYMLHVLQVNEEYRHYWQARFVRWMHLFFKDEKVLQNSSFSSLQNIINEVEQSTVS
ncbi:hypothetical protein KORDIASMS9_01277 [Kordia sp. SMS9]|uniref:hypothetical protein n=1 Tax=Kordia sp. SMS9 TaxID=2282170 RepID=UPI000E0D3B7A|nr:hypothetical protein [Kordia sp. SMS9]AXG69058.1 hypothetical protein KORDIASMS9_01277 [Kordia sp. SMS9]